MITQGGRGQQRPLKPGKDEKLMAYTLSAYERETIIRWDEESSEASFYTASPVQIRRMDKLTAENPANFREIRAEKCQGEICAKTYTIPKDFITIRSKRRILSEEQRAANAERLRKAREMKSEV